MAKTKKKKKKGSRKPRRRMQTRARKKEQLRVLFNGHVCNAFGHDGSQYEVGQLVVAPGLILLSAWSNHSGELPFTPGDAFPNTYVTALLLKDTPSRSVGLITDKTFCSEPPYTAVYKVSWCRADTDYVWISPRIQSPHPLIIAQDLDINAVMEPPTVEKGSGWVEGSWLQPSGELNSEWLGRYDPGLEEYCPGVAEFLDTHCGRRHQVQAA
jgi:hypothetical protein